MSDEHKKKISLYLIGNKNRLGHYHSDKTKEKISNSHRGMVFTQQHIENLRKSHLGVKPSDETREKMRQSRTGRKLSIQTRIKISLSHLGSKSYLWKGGLTKINDNIRKTLEYKLWRESVFERDNWTCQECGCSSGYKQAHHIKSFSEYPDLMFSVNNGITLCVKCHKKTDNYGWKVINNKRSEVLNG